MAGFHPQKLLPLIYAVDAGFFFFDFIFLVPLRTFPVQKTESMDSLTACQPNPVIRISFE